MKDLPSNVIEVPSNVIEKLRERFPAHSSKFKDNTELINQILANILEPGNIA